ncbi:hypothetical protein [Amnibacterium setariae]|uniref:hypothetical protein n=1 Tax=Amnibacterium setariae TaxID=2306585 RepID=UPI001314BC48|nr:hypothetical protein [Amnibacterium setariae]
MSLLLPEGARLLHIGPAKTGTTSLQNAFHVNRDALAAHGVHYAGRGKQPRSAAAAAVLGRRLAGHTPGLEAWPQLVAEVAASTAKRVVISSETFARAEDDGAARVIEAFGAERTHVVITMRPLADMLPSSWQQYVQTGSRRSWAEWLDEMLRSGDTLHGEQPEFWRKTRIDALARRWGALVGPERVTVVSLAAAPRDFVLRTFEQLTGLPTGVLVPHAAADNGSLPHAVVEVLRRFNTAYGDLPGATADVQAGLIEFGAVKRLRRHPELLEADDRIEVPRWAADRAAEIVDEMLAGVRAAGVRTVGDLDALRIPSRPPVEAVTEPSAVSTAAAAELLVGMMLAAGHGVPTFDHIQGRVPVPKADLDGVATRRLVGYAARRVLRSTRRRLRRG